MCRKRPTHNVFAELKSQAIGIKVRVRHFQGPPLPGSATPRVHHSQGQPLQGTATPRGRRSQGPPHPGSATPRARPPQGPPLPGSATPRVSHYIRYPNISSTQLLFQQIIIILINSNFYLHYDFFISPASTDAMVIQNALSKNSCMRIQPLVSVKDTLFYHSNFYLGYIYSILFASPASIYTTFFSLVQLLFNKGNTPASIYAVFFSSFQLLFVQYSFHHSSFYLGFFDFFRHISFYL